MKKTKIFLFNLMKRVNIIMIFSILAVLIIFLVFIFGDKNSSDSNIKSRSISGESISINRLTTYLEEQEIIRALPEDAKISIKPYNFNSGERRWEKEYKITGDAVQDGKIENPDVSIRIDSKYLTQLKENNLCDVIKQAKQNGELGFDVSISRTRLLWKYKSVLKYKDCFGG